MLSAALPIKLAPTTKPKWRVPYIDLGKEYQSQSEELLSTTAQILSQGNFILRKDVKIFEDNLCASFGFPGAVGVNSGTDALWLSAICCNLGPGDEVITSAHTYIATLAAIRHTGATPVLVDIGEDFNIDPLWIDRAITSKTKAIMPVHMNGRICEMQTIMDIANQHKLFVIEDAAPAMGAEFQKTHAGGFGHFGCFSLHPMKIIGAAGDGGVVTAKSERDLKNLNLLRNHGQYKGKILCYGYNSRLDNLQAALLNVKWPTLKERIEKRRDIARLYEKHLLGVGDLCLPPSIDLADNRIDTFSSYVVRTQFREALANHLLNHKIEVMVHWSVPLHQQQKLNLQHFKLPRTEQFAKEVLSLPIHPFLSDVQIGYVVDTIKEFFKKT